MLEIISILRCDGRDDIGKCPNSFKGKYPGMRASDMRDDAAKKGWTYARGKYAYDYCPQHGDQVRK